LQIVELKNNIDDDVDDEIISLKNTIKELQNNLELSKKSREVIEFHLKVTNQREEIIKITENLSDLQLLRQFAVDAECKLLQPIVDSINVSINDVCMTLFDKDINITLNLNK